MSFKKGSGKLLDAVFRPHRFFGAPSLIDPMLHPNDKYNQPKVAKAPDAPAATELPFDDTDARARQRQADLLEQIRSRRGRSSTIMSGRTGDTSAAPVKRRQLGYG